MAIFSGSLPQPNFSPSILISNLSPTLAPIAFNGNVKNQEASYYPSSHISRITTGISSSVYLAVQPAWSRVSLCDEPLSITVIPLSSTTLKVLFSVPVINNFALINPQNYIFTPSLTVESVIPNSTIDPTFVTLTVIGMVEQTYSLNIITVESS